jgi:hypothetical protein
VPKYKYWPGGGDQPHSVTLIHIETRRQAGDFLVHEFLGIILGNHLCGGIGGDPDKRMVPVLQEALTIAPPRMDAVF